jgi:hypothetical protein
MKEKTQPDLMTAIRDHNASGALDKLVRWGCRKSAIMGILSVLQRPFFDRDSMSKWAGMDGKKLKELARDARDCATRIQIVNSHPVGYVIGQGKGGSLLRSLPTLLTAYAEVLEREAKEAGPKRHTVLQTNKAMLVQHVVEATGQPHDEEVSALIAVAIGRHKYTTDAHKVWRHGSYKPLWEPGTMPAELAPLK